MTSASNSISEISYANQVLVDTQWLQDHKYDEFIRIAEVDYDPLLIMNLVIFQGQY